MKKYLSAFDYALDLLARYNKTEHTLRLKMKTKDFQPDEIDSAIKRLKEKKYLDDLNYAKRYAQNSLHKGNRLIRIELMKKGVCSDYIETALERADLRGG